MAPNLGALAGEREREREREKEVREPGHQRRDGYPHLICRSLTDILFRPKLARFLFPSRVCFDVVLLSPHRLAFIPWTLQKSEFCLVKNTMEGCFRHSLSSERRGEEDK